MQHAKNAADERDNLIRLIEENFSLSYEALAGLAKTKLGITRQAESLRKMYAKYAKANGLPPKRSNSQNVVATLSAELSPEQRLQLEIEELRTRRVEKAGDKQYKAALAEIDKLRDEMDKLLMVEGVKSTHTIEAKRRGKDSESTAVIVASDWHVEENVKPESVDYSNEYTMEIAKKRSQAFFRNALTLVKKEQKDTAITNLVVALIGDFFSGHIHDELMESCEVSPIDAALYAQELLADGIQYLLDNSELQLVIPCCVGNHSRTTEKVHVSTEQGNSLEWMIYKNLAQYYKNNKRVNFVLSRSYFTWVDVYGFKVRFHHGHAVKFGGGVGGITIPINKAIARFDQQQQAYLDVMGHFHQKTDGGKFIINGSLIGNTPYGFRAGFTGRPEQTFFLIQKDYGKTVVAPIFVD
ncbi:hypothetical protein EKK58_06095 [Candidatus Dependentiae bacterium]|nr:MAG: hypothetical protein EKK58_06095 [Candidatus Dependentiae bacterium]